MTIEVEKIPDHILGDILNNLGCDVNDEEDVKRKKDVLSRMSPEEAFNRYCIWHGIVGYSGNLIYALDQIRGAHSAQEMKNRSFQNSTRNRTMTDYILHMHNHAGWHTQKITAESVAEAIRIGLDERAGFLSRDYAGKYRIEHDDPESVFPEFRVIWDSDEPKHFPLNQPSVYRDDIWWSDRFQIGRDGDCEACGGTGLNHYYFWRQCWKCGDGEAEGRSSGRASSDD